MKDCYHVWQFLRDLLKDKQDDLVQWLDPDLGIFKIIKPNSVSNLWGFRKSHGLHGMKYANMARGIR